MLSTKTLFLALFVFPRALAQTQLVWPIEDQNPPVARSNKYWSWSFLPTTFSNLANEPIEYFADGLPSWVTFDSSTLSFFGTPTSKDAGIYLLQVEAETHDGIVAVSGWTLLSANDPAPTVTKTFAEMLPGAFSLGPSYVDRLDNSLRVPPGSAFTVTLHPWISVSPGATAYYSAREVNTSVLPSWLSFDNTSLVLSGVGPQLAEGARFDIGVFASDHYTYGDVNQTLSFVVAARLFDLVAPFPAINATAGSPFSYTIPLDDITLDGVAVDSHSDLAIDVDLSAAPSFLNLHYDATRLTISGTVPVDLVTESDSLNLTVTVTSSYGDRIDTQIALHMISASTSDEAPIDPSLLDSLSLQEKVALGMAAAAIGGIVVAVLLLVAILYLRRSQSKHDLWMQRASQNDLEMKARGEQRKRKLYKSGEVPDYVIKNEMWSSETGDDFFDPDPQPEIEDESAEQDGQAGPLPLAGSDETNNNTSGLGGTNRFDDPDVITTEDEWLSYVRERTKGPLRPSQNTPKKAQDAAVRDRSIAGPSRVAQRVGGDEIEQEPQPKPKPKPKPKPEHPPNFLARAGAEETNKNTSGLGGTNRFDDPDVITTEDEWLSYVRECTKDSMRPSQNTPKKAQDAAVRDRSVAGPSRVAPGVGGDEIEQAKPKPKPKPEHPPNFLAREPETTSEGSDPLNRSQRPTESQLDASFSKPDADLTMDDANDKVSEQAANSTASHPVKRGSATASGTGASSSGNEHTYTSLSQLVGGFMRQHAEAAFRARSKSTSTSTSSAAGVGVDRSGKEHSPDDNNIAV
jgi:hypothetical protein